ncbi:MAG TPA: hypothetical protein VHJ38_00835, partial [Nitrososphaeraceae archaeon]|nr:hypothetical protein [Nitrososphaeraceae archaeon]
RSKPLTRGTGNPGGPTVSSFSNAASNRPIVIEVPVIIDNKVFGRAVKKIALKDGIILYSLMISYYMICNPFNNIQTIASTKICFAYL